MSTRKRRAHVRPYAHSIAGAVLLALATAASCWLAARNAAASSFAAASSRVAAAALAG